jgi:hypothetical protein
MSQPDADGTVLPMTRARVVFISVLIGALMAGLAPTVQAQGKPIRSGSIVVGTGSSQRALGWPGEAVDGECQMVPDCLAWLETGCDPALAGREPAVTASIVDVSKLADGRTPRSITLSGVGLHWGEVLVQFWRSTPGNRYPWFDCQEIEGSSFLTGYPRHNEPRSIPLGSTWMTITTNVDNTTVTWALR